MPAQGTTRGVEGERFGWRELKTGGDKLLARALLEIVSAPEDLVRPGREHGLAPPIKLDAPCASVSNNRRSEVRPRQLRCCRGCTLDRVIDHGIDRLERQIRSIEIEHEKSPRPHRARPGRCPRPSRS